ncbi:glycosyltransferase family 2 protein [Aequorivita sp. F47161]|uniref:Glycosyltransferase family 2 protein n=1 Tax=Aequorivita vitellina TaxID=2874475 RepID=A0A9X1QZF4_9FLAO|nr:glycosyltransferase family A protein [Aequorivita vitellina]MCG2419878.1 glycosyltransferase family 2 protein [Aequorivita vitellina]
MKNLISIIIPCYNDGEFIEKSVRSALTQSYLNKEVIVVDDGSNIVTKKILRDLEPELDLLITQENRGQSSARNNGIQNASGDFILVLDSDDYFEPTFCEKAFLEMKKNEYIKLVTCHAMLHFQDNSKRIYIPNGGTLIDFLYSNSAIGNALFRKKDWEVIGGYDETMRDGWEDWEFYIRLIQLGGICEVIPEVLFHYNKRCNTTTLRANSKKYELWRYIFSKHAALYMENYKLTIDFLLDKIKQEESEMKSIRNKIDFRVGRNMLYPFRMIKRIFK